MKNEKSESGNSLFDYVRCELRRGYELQNDEQRYRDRREKFYIFLQIPSKLETFLFYGFFQCVDAFLFVLTFLPFRFIFAILLSIFRATKSLLRICSLLSTNRAPTLNILNPAETCDILKGIIVLSCIYLMNGIDISMIYHIIKSQSVIKLYIFFNMLEVADKLLSSFGQDILDALYWTATETRSKKRQYLFVVFHIAIAIAYVFMHSILVLLQATTLNVAINSKNKALLTVMMSNNFVELKSMVFKKFEKNNLFHMSCSDVRERFHYVILLIVVIIQTMKEYNWSDKQFWILIPDCLMVFVAEIFVDWFKHAFVTRFNEISTEVYEDYSLSLAYDLVGSKLKSAFSDHSDIVSRRMGFIPLPLSVLFIRILSGSFLFNDLYSLTCLLCTFLCLITFKMLINVILLGVSCKLIDEHRRTLEGKVSKVLGGHSASLPTSRHNSVTDLAIMNEEEKLQEIKEKFNETTPTNPPSSPNKVSISIGTRSTPHSQSTSPRNSLEDITEQVSILQDTLESSIILSDSTVSLISINDGQNIKLPETLNQNDENELAGGVSRLNSPRKKMSGFSAFTNLKRRVSLQELPNNIPFSDSTNANNSDNKQQSNQSGKNKIL